MNRRRRLSFAALAVGAVAVAGCCAFRCAGAQPAEREAKLPAREASPAALPAAREAPQARQPSELDIARQLLAEGRKFEARALLTRLILAAPEGPGRDELRRTLETINKDLFFSKPPASARAGDALPDSVLYTVRPGDTLAAIAKKQGRDVYFAEVIMLVNGIRDAKKIRPGQTLRIPQGKFSATVQQGAHRLIILLNGHYIKEYPVGLGAPASPTPEGLFTLDNNKAKNPDWTALDGNVYKYGDPNHILGTRWMGFKATEKHHGLGIHGTTDPLSIGKDMSNGCVRMSNHDVEEIFGMLAPGDAVEIAR